MGSHVNDNDIERQTLIRRSQGHASASRHHHHHRSHKSLSGHENQVPTLTIVMVASLTLVLLAGLIGLIIWLAAIGTAPPRPLAIEDAEQLRRLISSENMLTNPQAIRDMFAGSP